MKYNKSGYSIIVSLFLIAFIIILTAGIFRLVMNEMRINKAMGDYLKAYIGAESAQELALLDIKKKGYGYIGEVKANKTFESKLLNNYPEFNANRDVLISYYNDGKVSSYSGILPPLSYDIIPLFYIDDIGEKKTNDITMNIKSGIPGDLSWNIVGNKEGISGVGGSLNNGIRKSLTSDGFSYNNTISIGNFLKNSSTNYLVLFNSGKTSIEYDLNSEEFFTKPRLDIYSTGEVGEYKQNLKTNVDNTEFLGILKYSIYSN